MDIANLTLTGLVAIGVVNVIGFFKPGMDSRLKFFLSFVAAFVVMFVPAEIGGIILKNSKIALEAALAASGVYKLSQKIGGE